MKHFLPTTVLCTSAHISIWNPCQQKHFIKNTQLEEHIALGTALQYDLRCISLQKHLFYIPNHKWNIFCVAGPARLCPLVWLQSVSAAFFNKKNTDEDATYQWLELFYIKVSCYQQTYAFILQATHRALSLHTPTVWAKREFNPTHGDQSSSGEIEVHTCVCTVEC